ncbi:MAG: MFS transporter [Spirochaetia bacterium]
MNTLAKKVLTLAIFHQSLHWFSMGFLIPITALFQLEQGLSLLQVSLNMGIYSAVIMLLELPTGGLADVLGRKNVYLLALAVKLGGYAVFLFAQNMALFLVGFVLLGIFRTLASGSIEAHFIDELKAADPNLDLQQALAKMEIFIPLGLALGALTGGILPDTVGRIFEGHPVFTIYTVNILASLCGTIFLAAFTALFVHETWRKEESQQVQGFSAFKDVLSTSITYGLKNKTVLLLVISSAGMAFAVAGLEAFWQPRVQNIAGEEAPKVIFGLLSSGYFFAASLGSAVSIWACRVFKKNYAVTAAVFKALTGAAFIVLALQNTVPGFAVFYMLLFLQVGVFTSPHSTILNNVIPAEKRSTLLSFQSLFNYAGGIASSILLGLIAQFVSIPAVFTVAGIVMAGSAVVYLFIDSKDAQGVGSGVQSSPQKADIS